MIFHRNFATVVTVAASALLASTAAQASGQYSFPSVNGAQLAATPSSFLQTPPADGGDAGASLRSLGSSLSATGASSTSPIPPPPVPSPDYRDRYGARSSNADAYGYRFLTGALASASFANYAADYYRLFAPGHAVSSWTDRVSGMVEVGYGSAVDSWTAGAYYLSRVPGRARHAETAPDLTLMPTFRAHPELQENPTFSHHGN